MPLVLGAGLVGCAYYNGLYNARQLASQAETANREGRRGEAQSLWVQVAIKAESVAVRFPDSKYHDDALFMQGFALHKVGDCDRAVVPLGVAIAVSEDTRLVAESRLVLAECWLALGDAEAAQEVLDPLAHLVDPSVNSRRALLAGRAALLAGEPENALPNFQQSSETDARYERAVTLLALGRVRDAASVIDSTREEDYSEERWSAALTAIANVDHRIASALVDRLREDGDLTTGQEARLLITDGERWAPRDQARARTRFLQAADAAGDSVEATLAVAHVSVLEFRQASRLEELGDYARTFIGIVATGGNAISWAEPYAAVLGETSEELTSGEDPVRLFRRAEDIRDELQAPLMAAAVFAEVSRRYPSSVIAPKSLLAHAALRPQVADSVGQVLRERYPASPYTRVIQGLPAPGYTAIEDSLRTVLDRMVLRGIAGRRRM